MGVLAFGDSSTWATRADAFAGETKAAASSSKVTKAVAEDRKVGQVVSLKSVHAPSASASGAPSAAPRSNPNFAPRSAWPGAPHARRVVPSLSISPMTALRLHSLEPSPPRSLLFYGTATPSTVYLVYCGYYS